MSILKTRSDKKTGGGWLPRTAVVFLLASIVGLNSVASAYATGEARPLKITKFTFEVTEAIKTPVSPTSWGFENRPISFTQAGARPDSLTAAFEFEAESVYNSFQNTHELAPTRDVKDVVVDLPPGLLGNPTAVPRCPLSQALGRIKRCPAVTQVGVAAVYFNGDTGFVGPIVNVVPEAGQSAEFALENEAKFSALLTGHVVHTTGGYGLSVSSNGIAGAGVTRVETTFWGVPSATAHDPERGRVCSRGRPSELETAKKVLPSWACGEGIVPGEGGSPGGEPSGEREIPFLTWPSDCATGPERATISADSWQEPGVYTSESATVPGVVGCNLLTFSPEIEVSPDTTMADEPVGLGVDLKVPQVEEGERLATPELRSAVVTLPEGMSISPGIVDGIRACNESGPEGINFTGAESEEIGLNGELQLAAGHCPNASKVGEAEAITPLLSEPVKGSVYLARPGCGGPQQAACTEQDALDGNLYKLYLELGGTGPLANTGIHVKVPGEVEANPATGQLTTRFEGFQVGDPPRFDGNPQLPFSELKVDLNSGPRSPIDNPPVCGPATTTADLQSWSGPGTTPEGLAMAGLADATPSSFFSVEGCGSPPRLEPGFVAGTVTPNAGKFSSFTLNISRQDREQYIKGVQVHTPPGLLGMLSNVQLCDPAQANDPSVYGECPVSSMIGTTRVATGAGSHPFEIEGSIYLTGPYEGAPFGLSIVTHAVAGPFNLGLVVVRARIEVDPEDSTLTVTTDETGPYALPQIVFGVPLRLQRITVDIDRPDFMFNPTNCAAQKITAVISGSQDTRAEVSSPFAVGNCHSLLFKPRFTVSTSGYTSRAKGANLDTKLSYPKGAMGNDANIAKVKVSLPRQLPSQLKTLQQACTAAQFARAPAGCPAASVVGIARASTPLLPVGLAGPVYFVSHGGEAFPSLIIVLQGDNVRVDLVGSTFISKAGITSSTFKTLPDVPVNTFELYLPQGKYSALAANGNLCAEQAKLKMPTEFTAQNGMVQKQSTQIKVTGCAKHVRHVRMKGHRRK
jgi:hypothetical protein